VGLFVEKNRGRKSRDTVLLRDADTEKSAKTEVKNEYLGGSWITIFRALVGKKIKSFLSCFYCTLLECDLSNTFKEQPCEKSASICL
jgi:hypothetical protein